MSEWLRSHARLVAGALVTLLVAGVGVVLRTAGPAHAGPASPAAETIAGSSPAGANGFVAPVGSTAPPARRRTTRHAAPSGSRHSAVRARRSGGSAGQQSPAPTSPVVAQSLRRAAGLSLSQVAYRPVCARPSAGHASCAAEALVLRSSGAPVRPHVSRYQSLGRVQPARARGARAASVFASAPPQPDTPAYLQQAYDLSYLSQTGGASDTVAIVDANDDPSAEADLATYRSTYGLPACTTANGCLKKVNQTGATSSFPAVDPSWRQETSLDLDAVSAICPLCHIVLVEANSSSFSDLQAAMQTAVALGANQISASWVGTSPSVPAVFHTFPGVATVAATGDYGYPGAGQNNYPAALPGVTAAGGTSLAPAAAPGARGFSEGAWSWNGFNGAGSGCDLHFPRPYYQPARGCAGRAYADLSADADPATGLQVYDNGGWTLIGGTSLAAPLIAAYYAITGASSATPRWAYTNSGSLNDVAGGSTGDCDAGIAYICDAGPGYDGPTGVGSISGAAVTGAPGIGGPSAGPGPSPGGNTYTKSFGAHDATIAAGIYRNGLDTTWWIEYGTSTAYGSQTPASDIGAGSSAVAVTGSLSQLTAGTSYHYRIVARNKLGTTYGYDNTFTTPAAAAGSPMAAFAVSPGAPAPNSPVSFDASGSSAPAGGSITDYSWNFGDGTTADTGATAAASHTYTARGTYTPTLTVTSNGHTDAISETITVDTPPTAAFTPSATAVTPGTAVAFDGGASGSALGGSITDYSWSFGDGSSSDTGTTSSASHTFTSPGTYTVTLTTTDDLDVSSTVSEQVTVASFTASPAVAAPGSPVTFTVPTSGGAAGASVSYTWDFGDGSPTVTTTSPTTTHTYSARGPYSVKLTVQTNVAGASTPDGNSSQSAATLTVDAAPSIAFAPSVAVATPGSSIAFDAGASSAPGGSISHYRWDFGDGSSSQDTGTAATTAHTFGMPGRYTVTLTITDDLGQTATTTQAVTVDQPSAAFTVSPTPTLGTATGFDASNSTDPQSTITGYRWDFGDNSSPQATGANATHTYAVAGTYTVALTVTNALGLTATTSTRVIVAPAVARSNPPSTPVTPVAPTPTPAPSPTPPPPPPPAPRSTPAPPVTSPLTAQLAAAGKLRLTSALRHGLRLSLATSQSAAAAFQITIPLAETRQAARASGDKRNAPVVLLRRAQTSGAGTHTIMLQLSRAAAGQLAATGPLVLTVRVTLTAADGTTITRSAKITLTR